MLTRGAEAWIARLEAADVPCGRINNYEQVFQDPQVQYRGLRVDMPKAGGGVISTIASPLRLCGTPVKYELPPPAVGARTDRKSVAKGKSVQARVDSGGHRIINKKKKNKTQNH